MPLYVAVANFNKIMWYVVTGLGMATGEGGGYGMVYSLLLQEERL